MQHRTVRPTPRRAAPHGTAPHRILCEIVAMELFRTPNGAKLGSQLCT